MIRKEKLKDFSIKLEEIHSVQVFLNSVLHFRKNLVMNNLQIHIRDLPIKIFFL